MATHRQSKLTASGIRAGYLVSRLEKHADGEIEMSPTQIRAAEILLDRALPKLSAVEQTNIDPAASMSEAEIVAQMTDLAKKYPHILRQVSLNLGPKDANAAPHSVDNPEDGRTKVA